MAREATGGQGYMAINRSNRSPPCWKRARTANVKGSGIDSCDAFIQVQQHLVNLAHAYVERVILEQFLAGIAKVEDADLGAILTKLAQLFALSRIEQHKGWYLEHGFLSGAKSKAIRRQVDQLAYEVSREAVPLVDVTTVDKETSGFPLALSVYFPIHCCLSNCKNSLKSGGIRIIAINNLSHQFKSL